MCLQANSDADEVDLFLIVTLIKYICGEPPYSREEEGGLILGAVLVFLPGANLTKTHINLIWPDAACCSSLALHLNCHDLNSIPCWDKLWVAPSPNETKFEQGLLLYSFV